MSHIMDDYAAESDMEVSVEKNTWMDHFMTGEVLVIGAAEAVYLAAIIFEWTFGKCVIWFLGMLGFMCILLAGGLLVKCRTLHKNAKKQEEKGNLSVSRAKDTACRILLFFWMLLFLSQLAFILIGQGHYLQGDMTVETVGSFLETGQIYQINPLTGHPYAGGIPARLKILCLPALYGSLCKILELSPGTVVWTIIPTVVLISSYVAFYALACSLFPMAGGAAVHTVQKKRYLFLVIVSLLLWAGTYFPVMDGFQLLYCGWRGVAIRNGVLLPWLLALCLRRKWGYAILCVLAEACIVWTFYGMGVCVVMMMGIALAKRGTGERPRRPADSFWD